MKQRLISAAFMIAIGLPLLVIGGLASKIFLYCIMLGIDYEASKISGKCNIPFFMLAILFQLSYFFLGKEFTFLPIYIVCLFLVCIFDEKTSADLLGSNLVIVLMATIAINAAITCFTIHRLFLLYVGILSLVCDAGAYFVGRKFGKHKLCERISPKKTKEGAIGGIIVAFICGIVFAYFVDFFGLDTKLIVLLAITMPFISEIGDLCFSLIKRHFNIKDFSNLIPGHGGLLDRFDSVIVCLLVVDEFIKLFIL